MELKNESDFEAVNKQFKDFLETTEGKCSQILLADRRCLLAERRWQFREYYDPDRFCRRWQFREYYDTDRFCRKVSPATPAATS